MRRPRPTSECDLLGHRARQRDHLALTDAGLALKRVPVASLLMSDHALPLTLTGGSQNPDGEERPC